MNLIPRVPDWGEGEWHVIIVSNIRAFLHCWKDVYVFYHSVTS